MKNKEKFLASIETAFGSIEEMGFESPLEEYLITEEETELISFFEGIEPIDSDEPPLGYMEIHYSNENDWLIEIKNSMGTFTSRISSNKKENFEYFKNLYESTGQEYYIDFEYLDEIGFSDDLKRLVAFFGYSVCSIYKINTSNHSF